MYEPLGIDLVERTAGNLKSALRIVSWPALVSRGVPDPFLWRDGASLIAWFDAYYRTFIERVLNALGVFASPQ